MNAISARLLQESISGAADTLQRGRQMDMTARNQAADQEIRRQLLQSQIAREGRETARQQRMESSQVAHYGAMEHLGEIKNKAAAAAAATKEAADRSKEAFAAMQAAVNGGGDALQVQKTFADAFQPGADDDDHTAAVKNAALQNPMIKAMASGQQVIFKQPGKGTGMQDSAAAKNAALAEKMQTDIRTAVQSGDPDGAKVKTEAYYAAFPGSRPKSQSMQDTMTLHDHDFKNRQSLEIDKQIGALDAASRKPNANGKQIAAQRADLLAQKAALNAPAAPADSEANSPLTIGDDEGDDNSDNMTQAPAASSSNVPPPPAADVVPDEPDNADQNTETPLPADAPVTSPTLMAPAAGVAVVPQAITDSKGVKWLYHGAAKVPQTDTDTNNWTLLK